MRKTPNPDNLPQVAVSVTALLPVKNGMRYILSAKRQLSSACRISDEILVIDDNSTDGTSQELQKWASEDSRVRVIKNNADGLVSALNFGLAESRNNWIARFDIDDKYSVNRIDLQTNAIKVDTIAIFTDYEVWTPGGDSLGQIPSPVDSDAVKISLINSRRTPHPSVLYSKEAVTHAGGYRAEDFPAEDLSLWLRMSRIGNLVSIPKLLLNYELGKNSVSGQNRDLIMRKTVQLFNQIGIQDSVMKSGILRVDEILQAYEGLPLGPERKILYLQELLKVMEIKKESNKGIVIKKLLKNLDANMVKSAIGLSVGAKRRRNYRKLD